jgi:hypothetical protein
MEGTEEKVVAYCNERGPGKRRAAKDGGTRTRGAVILEGWMGQRVAACVRWLEDELCC